MTVSARTLEALVRGIRAEIDRVYWNVNQEIWRSKDCGCPLADCGIEGFAWVQPAPWDEADCSGSFTFEGVEVQWYKRLGRSMTTSSEMEPGEWVAWFERAIDTCDLFEERGYEIADSEANQPGSADHQCPTCHRWYGFLARRCGWDATVLPR